MRLPLFRIASLTMIASAMAANLSVDLNTRHQNIIGFGAGSVYYTNWMTAHPNRDEIYDTLFTGLGLSLLRIGNWNQDTNATLEVDSAIVAEGKKRLGNRMRIFMSSWTAPAHLKASGELKGKVNGVQFTVAQNTLAKSNNVYVYDQFAHWWKRSIEKYNAKGMGPDFISLQNEPDMNAEYEGTIFAKTEGTSAGYPQALKAVADSVATLSIKPILYGPEPLGIGYNNFQGYANKLDASLLGGWAYHLYHGNLNDSKYNDPDGFNTEFNTLSSTYTGKPWIMSEFCPMRSGVLSSDMLTLARLIQNSFVQGNASGYINWELLWGDGGQTVHLENPWNPGTWTTTQGYIVNPEYHGLRHYSRFVSPGWQRIASTSDDSDVRAVAFASARNDSLTVVVLNLAASARQIQLDPADFAEPVALWQSQVNGEMSRKVAIVAGQSQFDLPDSSVTTLVYTSVSSSALRPVNVSKPALSNAHFFDLLGRRPE